MTRLITRSSDGKQFHVGGRKVRASHGPRIKLASYLDMAKLTMPAPDCDYSKVGGAVIPGLKDVLGNDSLGDCTCAGVGHIVDLVNSQAGYPVRVTADGIIALYKAACGYQGTPATDQGGDELTVLDYVCEKGIDGQGLYKFDASIVVDGTNKEQVRLAMWLFGNLYFGVGLPDAWISPFPSGDGFTWDVTSAGSDGNNGHCFIGTGTNSSGVQIDTWGELGTITYAATAAYTTMNGGGELHTVLTCDWFNRSSQLAPSGFGFQDLLSDMKQLAVDNLLSD